MDVGQELALAFGGSGLHQGVRLFDMDTLHGSRLCRGRLVFAPDASEGDLHEKTGSDLYDTVSMSVVPCIHPAAAARSGSEGGRALANSRRNGRVAPSGYKV